MHSRFLILISNSKKEVANYYFPRRKSIFTSFHTAHLQLGVRRSDRVATQYFLLDLILLYPRRYPSSSTVLYFGNIQLPVTISSGQFGRHLYPYQSGRISPWSIQGGGCIRRPKSCRSVGTAKENDKFSVRAPLRSNLEWAAFIRKTPFEPAPLFVFQKAQNLQKSRQWIHSHAPYSRLDLIHALTGPTRLSIRGKTGPQLQFKWEPSRLEISPLILINVGVFWGDHWQFYTAAMRYKATRISLFDAWDPHKELNKSLQNKISRASGAWDRTERKEWWGHAN